MLELYLNCQTWSFKKSILATVIKKGLKCKQTEQLIDRELLKLSQQEIAADGKKRIKGIFNAKIYVNTIMRVFDKYGIDKNIDLKN